MKRGLFEALCVLAVAVWFGSCKEDPTASLSGTAASVQFEFRARNVTIADPTKTYAVARDAAGNPVNTDVQLSVCAPAIVTLAPVSDAPIVHTGFTITGTAYGTTCVVGAVGSVRDTMSVVTFPARIVVTSGPDSVTSGATASYGYQFVDKAGAVVAGVPAPTVHVDDTSKAQPVAAPPVSIKGRGAGKATLTFKAPGASAAGVTGTKAVTIVALPFNGSITPNPVNLGTSVVFATPPAGPHIQPADIQVVFGNLAQTLDTPKTKVDTVPVPIPDMATAGKVKFTLFNLDTANVSAADSFVITAPAAFDGTVTSLVYPGAIAKFTRGAQPLGVSADTARAYFNGVRQTTLANLVDSLTVRISDLADTTSDSVRLTRVGPNRVAYSSALSVHKPASFVSSGGTLSKVSGAPGDTVTLTRTGAGLNTGTRAYFNGVRTFVVDSTADRISVIVPGINGTAPASLRLTRVGASFEADTATFTSKTGEFLDKYDRASDDPSTAPAISANGDYFVVLSGVCTDGSTSAGTDDCNDFFKFTNSLARPDTISVRLDWFTGSDVDILWCRNAACSSVTTGGGATSNNPENSTVIIPAGATWYLWFNLFDPAGAPSVIARARVSGIG